VRRIRSKCAIGDVAISHFVLDRLPQLNTLRCPSEFHGVNKGPQYHPPEADKSAGLSRLFTGSYGADRIHKVMSREQRAKSKDRGL